MAAPIPIKAQKVWFAVNNLGDTLASYNGGIYSTPIIWSGGIPGSLLGQFWIEPDTQGTIRLCTFKTNLDTPVVAQFISGGIPYNLKANSFSPVLNEDQETVYKPQ